MHLLLTLILTLAGTLILTLTLTFALTLTCHPVFGYVKNIRVLLERLGLRIAGNMSTTAHTSSCCTLQQDPKTVDGDEQCPPCPKDTDINTKVSPSTLRPFRIASEGSWGSKEARPTLPADNDLYNSNASSIDCYPLAPHDSMQQWEDIWGNRDIGDISDEEFLEIRAKVLSMEELGPRVQVTTIFLRIPDADPDDLAPGAREHLVAQVERHFPNTKVLSCCFHRGSLLMSLLVATKQGSTGSKDSITSQSTSTWLRWLGMPQEREAQLEVNVSSRCTSFLSSLPHVAVTDVVAGSSTLTLRLGSSEAWPEGVLLYACMSGLAIPISFSPTPCASSSSSASSASSLLLSEASYSPEGSALEMHVPAEAASWIHSQGGMLMIEARCAVSKQVQGWTAVHLLPPSKQAVAEELQSLLCKEHAFRRGVGEGKEGKPSEVRQFVDSVGLWMEQARMALSIGKAGDAATHIAGPLVAEKTDFCLVRVGSRLLSQLVENGLPATADMVLQLLSSPSITSSMYVEALLQGCAHPDRRSLMHLAVLSGDRDMVKQVLSWCKDFNVCYSWLGRDRHGMTALHLAVLAGEGTSLPWLFSCCPEATEASTSHDLAGPLMQLRQRLVRMSSLSRKVSSRTMAPQLHHAEASIRANRSDSNSSLKITASALAASTPTAPAAPPAVASAKQHLGQMLVKAEQQGCNDNKENEGKQVAGLGESSGVRTHCPHNTFGIAASALHTSSSPVAPPSAEPGEPAAAAAAAAAAATSSSLEPVDPTTSANWRHEEYLAFRLSQVRFPALVLCILGVVGFTNCIIRVAAEAPWVSTIPLLVGIIVYLTEMLNMVLMPKPERHFGKGTFVMWTTNIIFLTSFSVGLLRPPFQNTTLVYQLGLATKFSIDSLMSPKHTTVLLPVLLCTHALFLFSHASFSTWAKLLCVAMGMCSMLIRSVTDSHIRSLFAIAQQQRGVNKGTVRG